MVGGAEGGVFVKSWNSLVGSATCCRNSKDPDVKNVRDVGSALLGPPSLKHVQQSTFFPFFFEGGCKQTAKHVVFLDMSLC